MTQNQVLGAVVGVTVMLFASVFVYQQYTGNQNVPKQESSTQTEALTALEMENVALVPETVDDIAVSIEAETTLDLSVLDEEESATLDEVEADSASVTNLGTSYDDNSY